MASTDKDYLAYNFSMPTYKQFVVDMFNSAWSAYNNITAKDLSMTALKDTVHRNCFVTREDIYCFFTLAVFWTILRYLVVSLVFRPLLGNLGKHEKKKAPESAWKLLFYSSTWCYSIYLMFFAGYEFFYHPPITFYKWQRGQFVPRDIYAFYMIQMSFYLHSVYGTLFMDVWRKDSKIMLLHHFVTMLLVAFSYAFRYTKVGVLVLFLHDVTDIILEFTKLVLYHKSRGGQWVKLCDKLSTIGFVLFGLAWFVFRLYWFPLKAMYASGHSNLITINGGPPFFWFFNVLLWILLGMNIYWFKFIVGMAYRVITGKTKEVEDTREFEDSSSDSDGSPKRTTANGLTSTLNGKKDLKKHR